MTEDQIHAGFVRQRRNLITISLVLLFVQFGEVTIREIKAVETTLLINHPNAVTWALWVAFFYWLYRYYVYFHDVGDKGFRDTQRARLAVLVLRWVNKKFATDPTWKDKRIENVIELVKKSEGVSKSLESELQFPHEWKLSDSPVTDSGLVGMPSFQKIPAQVTLKLHVKKGKPELLSITHDGRDQVAIVGFEAMTLNTRAFLYVLVNTRIFSQYYLPYLIALAPVVYFLLTK